MSPPATSARCASPPAFDWNGVLAPANVRVDAWVTPPVYTGKPPIILSAANKDAAAPDSGPLAVPAGSTLMVRSSGGTHRCGGGRRRDRSRAQPSRRPRAPTSGISRSPATAPPMSAHRPASRNGGSPRRPTARRPFRWRRIPERQARGSLQMSYKLEDDYGVTEARAQFAARPASSQGSRQGRNKDARPPSRGRCSSRRNFRWCCRMRAPATASARPSRISAKIPMPAPTSR